MTHARRTKGPRSLLAVTLATVVILLIGTSAAFAVKPTGVKPGHGRGGGTSTISLVLVDCTDGLAHYGQQVTFNISTTATDQPWVGLKCYQNGSLVGEGWDGFFEGSLSDRTFVLAAPSWTGGAADCTATLTTPRWAPLASTSFHVYG